MMNNFTMDDFTWHSPEEKSKWAISVPNGASLNVNPSLYAVIPKFVQIGVSHQGHALGIRQGKENDYKIPKSGSMKVRDLIAEIVNSGVRLPARYAVEEKDGFWIGVLEPQGIPNIKPDAAVRMIRKRNFKSQNKEADR